MVALIRRSSPPHLKKAWLRSADGVGGEVAAAVDAAVAAVVAVASPRRSIPPH